MDGRLSKALMGLGGTGAAAGGGLFLNKLLSGREKSANNEIGQIIKEEKEKAKTLEAHYKSKVNDGFDRYLMLSSYQQEFWESNWILKVESDAGYSFTYEKQEMEKNEKEYWEKIMKGEDGEKKIEIDKSALEAINGESIDYWQKYKKACEKWIPNRTDDQFKDNSMCTTGETQEKYLGSPEYKKYSKTKEKNSGLNFREFYWTEWKKFSKKCDNAMKNKNFTSDQISNFYDTWKTNPNTCQAQ